ncbi:hypothetical protein [Candidatus Flexifilum breve]|uniref:hypothetical protein n=1 Tax=Candidatus Flexifilum breve TaxID=3140694 RepID=UPI00331300A3
MLPVLQVVITAAELLMKLGYPPEAVFTGAVSLGRNVRDICGRQQVRGCSKRSIRSR